MCARILRREIEVLGWLDARLLDLRHHRPQPALKKLVKDLGYDTQRFRPAWWAAWISDWKNTRAEGRDPPGGEAEGGGLDEGEVPQRPVSERYDRQAMRSRTTRWTSTTCSPEGARDLRPAPGRARRLREPLPLRPGRRVPGHEPRPVPADAPPGSAGTGTWRVRRPGPVDLRLARGRHPQHPRLRVRTSARASRRARGAVKLEQNYRSTPQHPEGGPGGHPVTTPGARRRTCGPTARRASRRSCVLAECGDENDEANEIASRRSTACGRPRATAATRIAVFYRANFMQRALERGSCA